MKKNVTTKNRPVQLLREEFIDKFIQNPDLSSDKPT